MRLGLWSTAASAIVVAAGALALLLHDRTEQKSPGDLEPIVESPRPPVEAESPRPVLRGLPLSPRVPHKASDVPLVEERNARAREHRDAVALYEAGRLPIRDVGEAEMRLLDARHRLREIDGPPWHRARAVLLARDVERARMRVEAGLLPAFDEEQIRVSLELERMLAGDANSYPASREAFLTGVKDRHQALVEVGLAATTTLQEEHERLEEQFPTEDVARARDR